MTAPPAHPEAGDISPGSTDDVYAGLATRTLAFALDAAVINATVWFVGVVVAIGLSLLHVPEEVRTLLAAIGAGLALAWTAAYFAFFWSTTGQTPGNRLFRIRVRAVGGERLKPRRALVRFAGVTLAAIPLGAGFLLILVDNRRRGLHDIIARTVVVEAGERDEVPPPARRPSAGPRPDRRPA